MLHLRLPGQAVHGELGSGLAAGTGQGHDLVSEPESPPAAGSTAGPDHPGSPTQSPHELPQYFASVPSKHLI